MIHHRKTARQLFDELLGAWSKPRTGPTEQEIETLAVEFAATVALEHYETNAHPDVAPREIAPELHDLARYIRESQHIILFLGGTKQQPEPDAPVRAKYWEPPHSELADSQVIERPVQSVEAA